MEKQKDNPINMKDLRKREKIRFNISGGGGIILIGATVVAAAIGAAFVAYRDKRCSKQGGDRTSENGVDEKADKGLQNLLDPRKLGGSSNNLVIHEKVNQKHETVEETTEDNTDHEDGEKVEDGLKETGDSSTESNVDAEWPSAMIDQMKSGIKEEFAFGSLIETQETNPDRSKEENKHKNSYNCSTVAVETVKETVEIRSTDGKNEAVYDFSFWNNKLHKHKETEEVVKEALEKSEERPDDVFELEEEEHTSIERRNGNTFVVTSEKSENENYEKRVEDLQTEKEVGEEKGDEFSYVGVEGEQKSKGDFISNTELVEQEAKKVNETANVVNGKENDKGEDEQSALKEIDEKDEDKEEEQADISYEEVEGRVVEGEEEIFTQNEQRRGDDKGNTEGEDDDKDKGDGILYTELVEEEEAAAANEVNDTAIVMNDKEKEKEDAQSTPKETDEKDEYKEEQDNITYIEVEGKVVEKEEIFTQNEGRREDGKGNTEAKEDDEGNVILKEIAESETIIHVKETEKEVQESRINVEHREKEENTGVHLSVNLVEEKEKAEDVTLTEVREENGQKDIGYIHEKDNKVREEEDEKEQDDNTHGEVEGIPVQEKEHDDIRHVEEERIAMEKDNQDKYGDDIEVERVVVEEKEEKEDQKGGNDDVDSSEENEDEEQKEEYITVREESYEDMKPVKVVENKAKRDENARNLLLVEKTEDTDILAPIEAGEAKGKNEEGNKITLTEHDIADTKSSVNVEIEKDKEGDGIAYVGIEVEEQNTKGDIVYTELGKENKAGDIYNVVHGQQKLKEEDDDVEIIREDDIVYKEIDEKEVVDIELKEVEKIVVAEERIHVVVNKEEIKEENKDNAILKEIENGKEVQSVEEQKSRDIALSDEVNKEFINFTQEKDKKVDEVEEKERDDITHAEALLIVKEEEHEDTPQKEEGREAIEKEKEDKYGDDSNINVDVKLVEGHDSINMKNSPKEEENKEDETANTELNEVETGEAKKGDVAQEQEIKKLDEIQNKNSEENFDDMNKEISSDSFAAYQNEDNLEKEDEDDEDETANGMNQQFADHSQTENDNTKEDGECLVLVKEKKTTCMFMDHISKSLFLLVLAMSIAIGILSTFTQQDHLHYCYDHHLPQFCRAIFRFFFPSFNQTAKIQ